MKTIQTVKTAFQSSRSLKVAGATAVMAFAALGFAGAAQARDNVAFSVGIGVPGVSVGVTNAYPVYQQPVYVQPQPVYVQPQPVYYQRPPVYVQPAPVYYGPRPVFYGRPPHHRPHGGYYVQAPRGYGPGYAPVYYPGRR
jgi:PXPV repeat (3 copies)